MRYVVFVFVGDLRAAIEGNENGVLIAGLEDRHPVIQGIFLG